MRFELLALAAAAAVVIASAGRAETGSSAPLGLGHTPPASQITAWDIDVRADGAGLPAGSGTAIEGEPLFADRCSACHGDHGEGQPADALVGGKGTLASAKPLRTVGSYWPYATTLFDYVRRAMPYDAPRSLTPDQVYALSAYVLWMNGIVAKDARLDRESLPRIVMPNRHGFIDASGEPHSQGAKP